ncbi:MAG: 16S rRNA (cytidine(1402)-2'-O)-methyltransferase [Clostridia bacterium]|nr:16S rRNA (cytidine(1402)-2'-O)-methyltransferase [Clostridia bacterium]
MSGKLYVVGTPIGNLEDFSPRAKRILSEVDFIAAEDTRVTLKLLNHFEIKKELVSYFEHNKKEKGPELIARMLRGEVCALVTDAGMPAISDPGEDLVREAHNEGIAVESVPGPTAFATALAISGMPSARFCFEGFLSADKKERKEQLEAIKNEERTIIFYEAPHKLISALSDMMAVFGNRKIAVVKELTKIHENVLKTDLWSALKYFNANAPKGEYVLIIEGAGPMEKKEYTIDEALSIAKGLMEKGLSASEAAKEAASVTGIKKGDIYRKMVESVRD